MFNHRQIISIYDRNPCLSCSLIPRQTRWSDLCYLGVHCTVLMNIWNRNRTLFPQPLKTWYTSMAWLFKSLVPYSWSLMLGPNSNPPYLTHPHSYFFSLIPDYQFFRASPPWSLILGVSLSSWLLMVVSLIPYVLGLTSQIPDCRGPQARLFCVWVDLLGKQG
jgi:hypothetical protein